jgi:hypothetical protein
VLRKTIVLAAFFLLLTGCIKNAKDNESKNLEFAKLYSNCSMNIDVVFLPLMANYKSGDFITVRYKNGSESEIAFFAGSEIKIYTYDIEEQAWIEIANKMRYSTAPKPYIVLDTSGEGSSYDSLTLQPDIDADKIEELRVAIKGYILQNNVVTENCVGAYMDLRP